jgi:hypothetical protein
MGKYMEGLKTIRAEFEMENNGVTIPTQLRWLANPHAIRERRQNGDIAASPVFFIVKGNKVVKGWVKKGNKAAGVWY